MENHIEIFKTFIGLLKIEFSLISMTFLCYYINIVTCQNNNMIWMQTVIYMIAWKLMKNLEYNILLNIILLYYYFNCIIRGACSCN